ncbi:unnamed protein product [Medioppia subpectinata]|uniref:Protein kinase domain-containing protein n=1 Tax=Medioppia subpectinata TaxID=1979941 RepID=A0A7R9KS73_9ACAR|nr:unnamed protein product [Medioppia subpectinata]CAG2108857.1 unnamed protein product [Medioppia subpectinata]
MSDRYGDQPRWAAPPSHWTRIGSQPMGEYYPTPPQTPGAANLMDASIDELPAILSPQTTTGKYSSPLARGYHRLPPISESSSSALPPRDCKQRGWFGRRLGGAPVGHTVRRLFAKNSDKTGEQFAPLLAPEPVIQTPIQDTVDDSPDSPYAPTGHTPPVQISQEPLRRLQARYEKAPVGYGPDGPDMTSGALHLSSRETAGGSVGRWFGRLLPGADRRRLTGKTKRDLQRLRELGFDITISEAIGEGNYGRVFRGAYNAQIVKLIGTHQGKYLGSSVKPGQLFAAKYVQLAADCEPRQHLMYALERRIMKWLRHPNIVSYRVTINLGQRVILRSVRLGPPGAHIVTYRRMFLIMDFADQGTLRQFVTKGKCDDVLAVKFALELCSAMAYMHDNGVVHQDCHGNNILVFSAPDGQYTTKWTDFGLAISRRVYAQWGIHVSRGEMYHISRSDLTQLHTVLSFMVNKCQKNTGTDLRELRALIDELEVSTESLSKLIGKYAMFHT